MIAILLTYLFATFVPAVPQQQLRDERCVDPAAPLLELARAYDGMVPPATPRSVKAYELFKTYVAAPTPSNYHEALSEYQWLESFNPRDLHIKLALGVLYAAGPDVNFPGAEGYRHTAISNNSNADGYAGKLLPYVVAQDSTQWLAAVALTRIALVSPEKERMQQATSAVARVLAYDSTNIAARLAWHDLLIAQGRSAEALAFNATFPSVCVPMQHARAEALMLTGDSAAGVKLYLQALERASALDLHRFHDDIRVLATIAQLKEYEKTAPADRAPWILKLWRYNADSYARSLEARIVEHVVRAAFADANFRARQFVVSNDEAIDWIADSSHIVPWDSRGVLYVRHGAPLQRYRVLNQCLESYEAWVYSAEDKPWIVWFARQCLSPANGAPRLDDWRPIYAPPLCGRPFLTRPVPTLAVSLAKLDKDPETIDRRDIYTLLSQFDSRYNAFLTECAKDVTGSTLQMASLYGTFANEGQRVFRQAEWAESAFPHISKPAVMALAAYEFQDHAGNPELAALSWLRVADLRDSTSAAERMRFSYILTDSLISARRVDTTVVVPAGGLLVRSAVLIPNLPIGRGTLRIIALDPADSTRGALRSVPFNIRGNPDSRFGISDIVFAIPGAEGVLKRGSVALSPIPSHAVRVGETFRLFFEVYGISSQDSISVTVSVVRTNLSALEQLRSLFPGKRAARMLTFNRQADLDTRGVMVQDVDIMGDLLPGSYKVEMTVLVGTTEVKRRTDLHVVDEPKRW